jgi:ApeA N-terminal domain 1
MHLWLRDGKLVSARLRLRSLIDNIDLARSAHPRRQLLADVLTRQLPVTRPGRRNYPRPVGLAQGLGRPYGPLEPEIILGVSSDGRRISLQDCGKTSGNLAIGSGFSTSTFTVNTIFVGEHISRAEDIGFERLVVEYLHLEAWAHESGFDVQSFQLQIWSPLCANCHVMAHRKRITVTSIDELKALIEKTKS